MFDPKIVYLLIGIVLGIAFSAVVAMATAGWKKPVSLVDQCFGVLKPQKDHYTLLDAQVVTIIRSEGGCHFHEIFEEVPDGMVDNAGNMVAVSLNRLISAGTIKVENKLYTIV